ncbi:hypothetical protein HAX54_041629 [Datura stramonium]|uniref:Uncharacterized protein n=1 Tax=Datura stramonium TaxID=4076 RepID=A0ABS8W121_DATST|nr:hypothetical protein [Datura stramonium]
MFKARHEDGKGMGKGDCVGGGLAARQVQLGNSVGGVAEIWSARQVVGAKSWRREARASHIFGAASEADVEVSFVTGFGSIPLLCQERHWHGMTSAGCGSSASGWPMCMAFSQDKADLSDGKEALIKQRARTDAWHLPGMRASGMMTRAPDGHAREHGRRHARTWRMHAHTAGRAQRENRSWQAQAGAPTRRENQSQQVRASARLGRCSAKSGTDPEITGMWLVNALYLWNMRMIHPYPL